VEIQEARNSMDGQRGKRLAEGDAGGLNDVGRNLLSDLLVGRGGRLLRGVLLRGWCGAHQTFGWFSCVCFSSLSFRKACWRERAVAERANHFVEIYIYIARREVGQRRAELFFGFAFHFFLNF
jgi:hypothetical protein